MELFSWTVSDDFDVELVAIWKRKSCLSISVCKNSTFVSRDSRIKKIRKIARIHFSLENETKCRTSSLLKRFQYFKSTFNFILS